ncbi:MAG TPA: glycosyltransferase [Flavihumibacter sp.]|jgi:cellulose synthase/poly-beta-1,6-N-acetylglucosamine synthase-like glycosyltransferase
MIALAFISSLLLLAYAALIIYYHKGWKSLPELIPHTTNAAGQPNPNIKVTVIIPARNEAAAIRQCIESYLQQDYPPHLRECIVVDDFSEDATADIVREYAKNGVQLVELRAILSPRHINSYKKKAIETGIQHASGELIITTDADCILPPQWISEHVRYQQQNGLMLVAAPVRIHPVNSWLAQFQALDFLSLQGITGASHSRGLHAMCNGANLSYTKAAFTAVNGFAGVDDLASGDDMFLMQKITARFPGKTGYLKSRAAIVDTAPMPSWREFFRQRIRWASKARAYTEWSIQLVLALVYMVNLLLLGILIATIFFPEYWWCSVGLLLIKILIEWPFMFSVGRFFGLGKLVIIFPLFQPAHIIYTVIAGTFGQFGSYQWKGREVR